MRLNPDVNYTMKQVLEKIENNNFILPIMQRDYVWDKNRIEKLFDSIYRGYPIGVILCWKITSDFLNKNEKNYSFYEFIDELNDSVSATNKRFNTPGTKNDYMAILDGQQRITAINIGVKGKYISKKGRIEKLHFNILKSSEELLNDDNTAFKFYSETKLKNDETQIWIEVSELFAYLCSEDSAKKYMERVCEENRISGTNMINCLDNMNNLKTKFVESGIFKVFEVETEKYDEALEAFVRLNNQGKQLKKSDLLFSSITINYPNFRDWMTDFIKNINGKGEFEFDREFVLKCFAACLNDTVKYTYDQFSKKPDDEEDINIDTVKDEVADSIETVLDILLEIGMDNDKKIVSENMLIPLIYYNYKTKNRFILNDIKKYIIISIINGVFSSSSDTVGTNFIKYIKKELDNGSCNIFSLEWLKSLKKAIDIDYQISKEDIEDAIEKYSYGDGVMLAMLHLLYPDYIVDKNHSYDQDHMHSYAKLKNKSTIMKSIIDLSEEDAELVKKYRDKIGNLQLIPGSTNKEKSDMDLDEWIKTDSNAKLLKYCEGVKDYSIKNFLKFYEQRKSNITKEICRLLEIV